MRKILILSILTAFLLVSAFTQKDPAAEKILDKAAEVSKSYNDIVISFSYEYKNLMDDSEYSQTGTATLKDEKYIIDLGSSKLYFDGTTLYNFIPDVNEVTISEPDMEYDEFFLSNPSRIFVMYRDDFKYQYKGEDQLDNKTYSRVDLYPMSLDRDYSIVKLWIDKNTHLIRQMVLTGKSGDRYKVEFTSYKTNTGTPESAFKFDVSKHKGIEVIDTRGLK